MRQKLHLPLRFIVWMYRSMTTTAPWDRNMMDSCCLRRAEMRAFKKETGTKKGKKIHPFKNKPVTIVFLRKNAKHSPVPASLTEYCLLFSVLKQSKLNVLWLWDGDYDETRYLTKSHWALRKSIFIINILVHFSPASDIFWTKQLIKTIILRSILNIIISCSLKTFPLFTQRGQSSGSRCTITTADRELRSFSTTKQKNGRLLQRGGGGVWLLIIITTLCCHKQPQTHEDTRKEQNK